MKRPHTHDGSARSARRAAVWLSIPLLCGAALLGCSPPRSDSTDQQESAAAGDGPKAAVAELRPTEGHQASGTVRFERAEEGVRIVVHLENLKPGAHGFHVHTKGDCSAPDGTSAGGHFAPDGSPHGSPADPPGQRHVGDLGNVIANEQGVVEAEWTDPLIALEGQHSIVGRAVIVHADGDDFHTQPTGNAGARVACGVIRVQPD